MLPFYAAMVAGLLLITFGPQVVLFVPELIMGK
jgi:TRAP-type C4-dicarboxylate transport system permease large subunit